MKEKKDKNKTDEFKLPTYEGYTVVTRSVKPPKKIDKKHKRIIPENYGIDFSETLNQENEKRDKD